MTLLLQFSYLIAKFNQIFAITVIGAGDVIRDLVTITTEQLVKGQARHLPNDVPTRDIDSS